jgi:5-formyltetrahydrofolate cyclo-ligase
MDKHELRNHAKNCRSDLDYDQIESISQSVIKRIINLSEFKTRSIFHLFYPIAEKKEIDLRTLAFRLWNTGKTVVMPKVSKEGTLTHHKVHSFEELESTRWGMKEPRKGLPEVDPALLDVIIVPMLMGDLHKNRLGYGAGFYDRFLAQAKRATTIGVVADQFLMHQELPIEAHDKSLDIIATEKRMII